MAVWREVISLGDVSHNEGMEFPERRDAIVARLRASQWYKHNEISHLVEWWLGEAEDEEEFDQWWDELYDLADRDRVWIDTFARAGELEERK